MAREASSACTGGCITRTKVLCLIALSEKKRQEQGKGRRDRKKRKPHATKTSMLCKQTQQCIASLDLL